MGKMKLIIFVFILMATQCLMAQNGPVRIARDSLGVPHIFGKTDADVAYGLAWAHAEDDFRSIQLVMLSGKGMLGKAIGKDGAKADYVAALLRCRDIAAEKLESISPDFRKVLNGYIAGLNAYASAHPEEVLLKGSFPASITDYLASVSFSLCMISGADKVIGDIVAGKTPTLHHPQSLPGGSNAMAIHPSRTTTGEAFLAINSHQPLEGPVAWYEAHLHSEEGWNIHGGLFAGGTTIFHGVNEHLGWAHTVNMMDKIDVFQLDLSKDGKQYRFDGQWLPLEKRKVKLKIKGIPVNINRTIYWSKYGATLVNKNGAFAIRLFGNQDVRAIEQWYRMNKARNFREFYSAISHQYLPMMNIVYADRYDTIFYISGGRMPQRNPAYHWSSTVPGDTSATLWTNFHDIGELPQLVNPASGYLYNTNHSPFLATDPSNNLDSAKYARSSGYETYHNNRSARFEELINDHGKLDYASFKKIKFDNRYPAKLRFPVNTDSLFILKPGDGGDGAQILKSLQEWDRVADTSSTGAAAFLMLYNKVVSEPEKFRSSLNSKDIEFLTNWIRQEQERDFGRTGVTLGELQRHRRGNVDLPAWGLPDVITAMYSRRQEDGRYRVLAGESFIQMVRFPKGQPPVIETVNCYGSSAKTGSPHYTDQMKSYLSQQLHPVSLDRETILRQAVRVYEPGR